MTMKILRNTLILAALVLLLGTSAQAIDVKLSWTAPGDDDTVGTATAYDIRYNTLPITEDNWDDCTAVGGEPTPQIAGSAETLIISLAGQTHYYFAVKTVDDNDNWSGLSNIAEWTTGDDCPPATVTDLTVEEIE